MPMSYEHVSIQFSNYTYIKSKNANFIKHYLEKKIHIWTIFSFIPITNVVYKYKHKLNLSLKLYYLPISISIKNIYVNTYKIKKLLRLISRT